MEGFAYLFTMQGLYGIHSNCLVQFYGFKIRVNVAPNGNCFHFQDSPLSANMLAFIQESMQTEHTEYRDSVKMFKITKELGALYFNDRSVVGCLTKKFLGMHI